MKKKTKKRLITLVAMLVVLGACITALLVLKDSNEKKEKESLEDKTEAILAFDSKSAIATGIAFKSSEGEELSFSFVNDEWIYDGDEKYPVNQEKLAALGESLCRIEATVKLNSPDEDLSVYGLSEPDFKVKAAYSDNSEKTFLFGDTSDFNNCRYFKAEDDGTIYMVETSLATSFGETLDSLYQKETYQLLEDTMYSDNVISFSIITASGEENTISDEKGINELYDLIYYGFNLSDWEDYYATEDEKKNTYGIGAGSDRIVIKYRAEAEDGVSLEKEYTVLIGHKFEDAEADESGQKKHSYFYSPERSTVVYAAEGEKVDKIFEYLIYTPAKTADAAEQ